MVPETGDVVEHRVGKIRKFSSAEALDKILIHVDVFLIWRDVRDKLGQVAFDNGIDGRVYTI